jgi:hypothetical protein
VDVAKAAHRLEQELVPLLFGRAVCFLLQGHGRRQVTGEEVEAGWTLLSRG